MELWDIYDSKGNKLGKTTERGNPLNEDEYHLVVIVWIRNRKGQYLISRRSKHKPYAGLLETAGGAAISGEDSITAIIREVYEELGIKTTKSELKLLSRDLYKSEFPFIGDIWFLERDIDISNISLQVEEISEAMWLDREAVVKLIEVKNIFNWHIHQKLFASNLI